MALPSKALQAFGGLFLSSFPKYYILKSIHYVFNQSCQAYSNSTYRPSFFHSFWGGGFGSNYPLFGPGTVWLVHHHYRLFTIFWYLGGFWPYFNYRSNACPTWGRRD